MEPAVAMKLKGVVMTSSPSPMPAAKSDKIRASVPEAQPMANLEPSLAATSSSRSFTSGPRMKYWDSKTWATACMTSSRMVANCARRSRKSKGASAGEFSACFAEEDISLAPVIIVRQAGGCRRDTEHPPRSSGGPHYKGLRTQEHSQEWLCHKGHWSSANLLARIACEGLEDAVLDFLDAELNIFVHGGSDVGNCLATGRYIVVVGVPPDGRAEFRVHQLDVKIEAGDNSAAADF